jgi:hypothetical protein
MSISKGERDVFFDLTESQIEKITNKLLEKNVINNTSKEILVQYFKNDFSQVLKIKAKKNQIAYLFQSQISGHQRHGFWSELANKLSKNMRVYVNGKYSPIAYQSIYKVFCDRFKSPPKPLLDD